jgi:thiamine pyrophosphate-dependent acetolactate synthase large subunit-like protein
MTSAATAEPAQATATISVAEFVGRALAALGATHCFGVVGSGNFEVTNAFKRAGGVFTATRHENGAATMADAFARMSGQVALLSVHQGCGLTNAGTGICEAAKSRTPLIILAAESPAFQVNSNFAMDQAGFARSVGAVPERINGSASAVGDLIRAWRTARNQRRTVLLNLPLDVQAQHVDASALHTIRAPETPEPVEAGRDAIARLADAIEAARRPVIVAGRGARSAGRELRELGARAGAVLATSAVAKGLFLGDPFDAGISGGFSSPTTAELIAGADLIIGFGCALNMWTMRHGRLISPGTVVAQVDLEEEALGRNRAIDIGVVGDSGTTARALAEELTRRGAADPRYRTDDVRRRLAASGRWNDTDFAVIDEQGRVDPRALSCALNEIIPPERILSIDSGNFMGYPSNFLDVPDENGFCFTQSFQSIGLGLATAIGAGLAQPGRLPVLGAGDGGFLMAIAEVETAVRIGMPLLVIVYNDSAYGAEVYHFAPEAGDEELEVVRFPETDIAAIARGFGAEAVTVRSVDDLAPVTAWLASSPSRPLVIDAKVANDGGSWWLSEAFGH